MQDVLPTTHCSRAEPTLRTWRISLLLGNLPYSVLYVGNGKEERTALPISSVSETEQRCLRREISPRLNKLTPCLLGDLGKPSDRHLPEKPKLPYGSYILLMTGRLLEYTSFRE